MHDSSCVFENKMHGYTKGAKGIYMALLHMEPPVIMNLKKIRRLMDKFNLSCPIRKANPYRRMAKALKQAMQQRISCKENSNAAAHGWYC